MGANSDKSDRIRLLANNIFGFEDLSGGGDKDFNDVIIKVNEQNSGVRSQNSAMFSVRVADE